MFDLARTLRTHHGVCTTAQLTASGLGRHAIAAAVRQGRLERAYRGMFVDPGLPLEVRRAVRVGGRLSCISAAGLHGLRVLNPPEVLHVAVAADASRLRTPRAPESPVRLHWTGGPGFDATPIAPLEQVLADVLGCVPELDALCVLDSAREQVAWQTDPPMLGDEAFARLVARLPGHLRVVAHRSTTASQSVGETIARVRFEGSGIPVQPQVALPGGVHADLLIGERLVFEVDGEAPHSLPGAFDRDRGRWAWLKAAGYAHVSFSHRQVVHEWDSVGATVRMLVRRGEHLWSARPNSGAERGLAW
ncbi:Transcriptional regulator, AbiEi antitoxin, Type IV TA system [Agromyces sp. CF514]|uniref:type IV toxin-antitoxin system AbiEi family antitoxin domain-containing protein n=1 Tax=Agromyces sp. CF514 TaxID=1881031 RepID=UPI0008E84896|nr:type IV toxin-antitoxin system AbiEi family antitoxin domain-containing protein [Agromyces sp. CF514]SFR85603.1 Transcriptional regulator, AbiEi antitoxin, Type IV TA system [Agromyces sp. CF514]